MTNVGFTPEQGEAVAHLASPLALGPAAISNFRKRPQQQVISDSIVDAVMGRGPRFIAVSIPQQYGKSQVTSILTPAWWIELKALDVVPGGLVALISNEDSLSMNWSVQVRRLFAGKPEVFFSTLRKDSKAAGFWETEEGGGILAIGVGGSIVGRPVSLLIIDDPTKNFEQANSEKHKTMLWDFWTTVAIGRLQPWTIVLVVGTRWGPEDLIGRLTSRDFEGDPDDWKYIRIPAIADSADDPIGRQIGEPMLRPQADQTLEEATLELEKVKSSISTYAWNCLWQQDPVDPSGTIFFESKWRYWKHAAGPGEYELPRDFDLVVMSWDMAFKDQTEHDWVVGQAWGVKGADRYLLDQVRGHWGFTETCNQVKSFAHHVRTKYSNAQTVLIEDKANGTAIIEVLRSKVGGLVDITPEESKLARAWSVQPLLLGGNLYAPPPTEFEWVKDYTKELAEFPNAAHDDQVDATTQALNYLMDFAIEPAELITGEDDYIPDLANLRGPRTVGSYFGEERISRLG